KIILKYFFTAGLYLFLNMDTKNDLQVKDVYNASKSDLSGPLGDDLEKVAAHWLESYVCYGAYLSYCLDSVVIVGAGFIFNGPLGTNAVGAPLMLQPIVLAEYIRFYEISSKTPLEHGWYLGVAVILLAFTNVVVNHYSNLGLQRVGMRVRVACCSLVYRKLLRLSQASLGRTAAGQLVNLLSNDVQRFDQASLFLHYIWIMPIQFVIAFYVMYRSVGIATVAGMTAIILQAVPVQGYMSKLQGKLRFKIALRTDRRVKLMSEITSGIQVIKMYAWEKPFEKIVEAARRYVKKYSLNLKQKIEIRVVRKTSYIRGLSVALMVFTERLILYLTIITFVLLGERLTGGVVFSVAQLFNTVQLYTSIFFPMAIASYAEAKVSIKRLEEFLLLEENTGKSDEDKMITSQKTGTVRIVKANASWLPNPIVDTLMDINLEIAPGTLCCVVGSVGAGKSSLLQMILRELPLSSGKLEIAGSISYSSQEPWLFVSSVRNNILFGRSYERDRYRDIVKVCALERDFQQFPYGDKTLVGEKGVSLSGGQRARINLARTVYFDADIYLLDDPLSAVDTHGQIEKVCKYNELSQNELSSLKQESAQEEKEKEKPDEVHVRERLQSVASYGSSVLNEEPQETDELIEKGALSSSLYMEYCRAGASVFVLLFLFFLLIIAQMASNASDLWVLHWTNVEELRFNLTANQSEALLSNLNDNSTELPSLTTDRDILSNITDNNLSTVAPLNISDVLNNTLTEATSLKSQESYIIIYTIFIIAAIVLTSARSLLYYKVCMNASINLHNKMFSNILQAPMRFFDTNPSAKAPVFSHISASLHGMPTIRAANAEQLITKEFDTLQDQHTGTWFMFLASSESFGFYLDVISTIFLALVTLQFLIFKDENTLSGNVGLVISQSLILTGMLQFGVRQTAEVTSNMTSVERILQYTKLDKEGPFESLPTKKSTEYAPEDPPVLKNLNIEIKAGEKVGVVGRTGAGKSSLISAIFRLTSIDGTILIDDVDISKIGLLDLRSNISIIPQEPILFSSTIRYNLDPFEKVNDEMLWKALENVELKTTIDDLNQQVSEGGSNFSVGQRQLLCLARAIVRNNKILIMDEATANVDPHTDSLIQRTIRDSFKSCTVLTIAHRLNTIMDSDKVLVMAGGEVAEFGHPHELLQNSNGVFTKMVQQTGSAMEATLRKISQEYYEKSHDSSTRPNITTEITEKKKDD
ncbi:hypothetical protein NQ318_008870, partial [Aromia moschata]